ncbi:MAG: cellulase (glycosyl hydrolase family 5), partial [Oscillospiraceae bacterium]
MKTINRMTALLAAAVMMSFTACGKSDETAETTAETAANTEAAAEEETSSEGAAPAFTSDGSAKVTVDGSTFMVGGSELWINGVNTPW